MSSSAGLRPSSDELRARLRVNLRELRKRAGISQQELAFRADVHPSIVAALELEQKLPRIDTFIRLAGALEATPGELAAGILWVPGEVVLSSGGFDVADDPEHTAALAALGRIK